ncbi:hypothetical protein [Actinomadura sp. 9N215]|uniref:hypothetical protein n=1 Tax=Actinomadura sp. 9N215 TaxID=3375150 RepID=UPI00379D5E12
MNADVGLLDKLFKRETARLRANGVCDVCNDDFDPAAGYFLPTRTVVIAEGFWAQNFSLTKNMAEILQADDDDGEPTWMLEHTLRQMAGQSSAWAVCESCSEYFVFDRDVARADALAGRQPSNGGAVDPSGCVLFAALGWQRVFGDWPSNVAWVEVVDTCDLCEKAIHDSELSAFITTERMREMRAENLIDTDPVRPFRRHDDGEGYVQCQPCLARTVARAYRRGGRDGERPGA